MKPRPQVILSGFADEGAKPAKEQLTMLAALGLSHYSLRFVDLGAGVKNAMQLTKEEVRQLRHLHAEFGLKVASLGSPIGKVKLLDVEDGSHNRYVPFAKYLKEEVGRAIALAQAFGTRLIRGFSFYHPRGSAPEEHLEQTAAQLRRIAEKCGEAGVFFGLEVEANLVGQNGRLLAKLHRLVDHPHLLLVFDGGNLSSQNLTPDQTYAEYRAMRGGLGWMHIKDYRIDPHLKWQGFVDEERLKNFVPADQGDSAHEAILRDFKGRLPGLERRLQRLGLPGVFLDLEPHLKGGGQFGGYSGPDGFGVALRALMRLLDYVGIGYKLAEYADIEQQKR
jgi:sugar phosphate isomerase/epimerase